MKRVIICALLALCVLTQAVQPAFATSAPEEQTDVVQKSIEAENELDVTEADEVTIATEETAGEVQEIGAPEMEQVPSANTANPLDTEEPLPELKISEEGIQFIKDHEGFLPMARWDISQWTIGYGTSCGRDEYPDGITEEEADLLLRKRLPTYERIVDAVLEKSPLTHTQAQYDALVSFTFNLGQQWVNSQYYIYQYVVYGNYTETEFVTSMGSWLSSDNSVIAGLIRRRVDEANLYLNGDYTLDSGAYIRIKFNGAGGIPEEDYWYYRTGAPFGSLPTATHAEAYFSGWYDKNGTPYTAQTIVPTITPPSAEMTLYAHWDTTEPPEPPEPQFTDVPLNAWYYDSVYNAVGLGLFTGLDETTFAPEEVTNRAMLVTVLHRMAREPEETVTTPFIDVPENLWFSESVAWAYANDIVRGMTATTFEPFFNISREQLATMLYRYAVYCEYDTSASADLSGFADEEMVSPYALDALCWAVAEGIINGTDGDRLDPTGSATRAQCAAMMVRFLNRFEA